MNIERKDEHTPKIIDYIFDFPYGYFSKQLPPNSKILDCACGNRNQWKHFHNQKIVGIDKYSDEFVISHDISTPLPFEDSTFDYTFSFETIEHLDESCHISFIHELLRVTKTSVFIGSVAIDGLDFVDGIEIFKSKNGKNPYHLKEYSTIDWMKLFNFLNFDKKFYISKYINNNMEMSVDTMDPSYKISNYIQIDK